VGPRHDTKQVDSLEDFLAALRRPLEFLLNASPATAARTHLPGNALALRARALADAFPGDRRRGILESLAQRLETFEAAAPEERGSLAQRLWEELENLTRKPAPPPYRMSKGELQQALEQLQRPVQFVRGVGPRRAELLRKSGIQTVEDLLFHLPFRYEDRRRISRIRDARPGEDASVMGELAQLNERIVGRARRRILEGVLRDETGLLGLTWYNQVA
jgi:ATP-dependent DNA helicase RecG